jgi:hypothetical protein
MLKKDNKDNKEKITINIDIEEDRPLYNKILKSRDWEFKNNLELFTLAALVGKFIVQEKKPINKSVSYIRVKDNISKDDMVILKSLAISDANDVNIISNEDEMFKIVEQYARTGIKVLYDWFNDKNSAFDTELSKILLKKFKENKELEQNN